MAVECIYGFCNLTEFFLVCFSTPMMSLIEIQMKLEDKINGDKLGAPSGSAAPLTQIFCSKTSRRREAKLEKS